jgi:hypothetical protein
VANTFFCFLLEAEVEESIRLGARRQTMHLLSKDKRTMSEDIIMLLLLVPLKLIAKQVGGFLVLLEPRWVLRNGIQPLATSWRSNLLHRYAICASSPSGQAYQVCDIGTWWP